MDQATYDKGLEIRRSVLGKEFVDAAIANATDFNRPLQEYVTEMCWGAIWGRPGLDKKQRSISSCRLRRGICGRSRSIRMRG